MIAIISRSMKLVLTSILMLLVFIQSFSNWFIFLEYQSNRSFIAEKLCVNKTRPMLHCNGKCQMMKKMAEQEQQNSSGNGSQERWQFSEIPMPEDNMLSFFSSYRDSTSVYTTFYQINNYNSPLRAIFHPPA